MPRGPTGRHVALVVAVGLLVGCTVPGDRVAMLEGRVAAVEGRMALAEGRGVDVADPSVGVDAQVEKTDFRAALDVAAVQAALDVQDGVQAEVVALELDTDVDLVKATIRPVTGDDADVAWESAKALAPLFATLAGYAPALDLQVGDTRCICSTQLMKGIATAVVDRAVWSGACTG